MAPVHPANAGYLKEGNSPMRLGKSGSECRTNGFGWIQRAALSLAAALLAAGGLAPSAQAGAVNDWFENNFEVHGFLTSKFYVRSSNLALYDRATISSWRSELNLEMDFFFYDGEMRSPFTGEDESLRITGYAIVRPTYEAVYDINDKWGKNLNKAQFGTFNLSNQQDSHRGKNFPGSGARVDDEFTIINNDTGTQFTGNSSPAVCIDDRVFLGCVGAAWGPRSSWSEKLGGPATLFDYQRLNLNGLANLPSGGTGLTNSLALSGTEPGLGQAYLLGQGITPGTVGPTPGSNIKTIDAVALNFYAPGRVAGSDGHFGSASSFDKGYDINRRQSSLSTDCFDAAHPFCWLREFYVDIEWGATQFRLGRQQIVWGKTDAFRLQDKINPIDVGFHNIFPDLEERRIPVLALDIIHSFGDIGVFKDVSFEFAWIFDKYIGDQAGQCGEPYAFTGLCHFRADIGGHGVLNWGSRFYDEVDWNLQNTEPWARVEFRIPKPSISFSISAGWTHEDAPYAEFIQGTQWSYDNPNPAAMLFLQGLGLGPFVEQLSGQAVGSTVWSTGFDALSHSGVDANGDGIPDASGSLAQANQLLLSAWQNSVGQCAQPGATNRQIGDCFDASGLGALAFPWVGSEAVIRVNRIFTVGGSLDYQIPRVDTILRMEMAWDFGRKIQDTSVFKGYRSSDVFQFAIGLDRSTFIPFLNKNRTAFLSVQTFLSHIVDYNDVGSERGMVPYEDQVISTFFMQNYWRNDTLILTSFVAILWKEENIVTGPSLRYVHNDNLFFDVGINLLWGQDKEMNIWDLCNGSRQQGNYQGVGCLGDPTTWAAGQWQTLNHGLEPASESAFGWARQGIADRFQRKRDEIWIGVTYQF